MALKAKNRIVCYEQNETKPSANRSEVRARCNTTAAANTNIVDDYRVTCRARNPHIHCRSPCSTRDLEEVVSLASR